MYKVLHMFDNSNVTNRLSKGELVVYHYINQNLNNINQISAEKLAQETYTSPATINRMCKKLGIEGYSHLKHSLIDDLKLEIKNRGCQSILNETLDLINEINFDESIAIANTIRDIDVLFIYSVGASNITATYLERQLLNCGIKCIEVEQQKMLENFPGANLLIISSSGETERTIDLVQNIKSKNNIIALTAKDSRLDKLANDSFTHNVLIDKLNPLTREQQIHMLVMVNDLVAKI